MVHTWKSKDIVHESVVFFHRGTWESNLGHRKGFYPLSQFNIVLSGMGSCYPKPYSFIYYEDFNTKFTPLTSKHHFKIHCCLEPFSESKVPQDWQEGNKWSKGLGNFISLDCSTSVRERKICSPFINYSTRILKPAL